jgi:hypothetical protein
MSGGLNFCAGAWGAACQSITVLILIQLLNITEGKRLAVPTGRSWLGCSAMLVNLH